MGILNQKSADGSEDEGVSWLAAALGQLHLAAWELSRAETPDDVMRRAVELGRDAFGFRRIGCWFFEDGQASLVGSFGIDDKGELSDERALRIFDRSGSLPPMFAAWKKPPHFFYEENHTLRTGAARVVGRGIHIMSPLVHKGEDRGFMSIDDLLEGGPDLSFETGYFLNAYAAIVSGLYFSRLAEAEAARAREAAANAERVKSEFLGMMSHEIRTPLNAIMGFAQLLCAESDSPSTRALTQTIEENGDHLSELIGGMLEYAGMPEGRNDEAFAPCDPVAIAASSAGAFSQVYRQKGLQLDYAQEGDDVGFVMADGVGLRQILGHLLQNALKFTPQGSVRLGVQARLKSDAVAEFFITVEDTGIGMDPALIPEIFKPLRQLDSSRTRFAGGVGMGLAIVERLVKGLGGRIECRSESGRGSRFALHFEFERAASGGAASGPFPTTRLSKAKRRRDLRVLAAVDHESSAKVLSSMLEHLGYPAPEAVLGAESARARLLQRPYDLVAIDVDMPGEDGLELTRSIRAGECGPMNQDAVVVGIAAFSRDRDFQQCLSVGMDACVAKPIKLAELERALASVMREPDEL